MTPSVQSTPRRARRTVAALTATVVAAGLGLTALPAQADDPPPPSTTIDKLGSHDRALVARYAAQYRTRGVVPGAQSAMPGFVTLMYAVRAGTADDAAARLTELGAEVTRVEAEVGYVKANVPFALVDETVALEEVLRVDADELLALEDTTVEPSPASAGTGEGSLPKPPSSRTPDNNPYLPTNETGSVAFKNGNKTFDGRGITIGVVDTGVDPTHPALATTTTGEHKLVDTVTGTNPRNIIDLLFDRTWLLLSSSNKVTGATYERFGETWAMPEVGDDMYATVRNLAIAGYPDPNLTGYLGIAYREADNAVWVDVDLDHVFEPEELIRPFRENRQIAYIGEDDPATAVNERLPFTVEARRLSASLIGVNTATIDHGHGTHVAGIAAAHGVLGGAMNGQAPGAQVVSMKACTLNGCSSAALADGVVDLATNYGVDVINISIGSSPALNDGSSALALLYDRLIEETGVQIFSSAGNSGAGTNSVGDPSVASTVVSVGADVSKHTWWSNYGSFVTPVRSMFPFSSRGPREDGGLKPDISAPGAAVAPTPDWLPAGSVATTGYTLPAGYSMMQGTSMSSPQVTGAAALLLSAAQQRGLDVSPEQLRSAIYSTADYNKDATAAEQGRGRFDVAKAWKLLSRDGADSAEITVSAPVCTVLSEDLATPHTGPGLYNSCAPGSGGQAIGEPRTYEVVLTRTSGAEGPVTYRLGLQGNDGTFSAPSSVELTKDVPAVVQVTAHPAGQGLHSALLRIDDPATGAVEQFAILAVQAAASVVSGESWTDGGSVRRNGTTTYSIAVPEGATSLTVSLSGVAADSQTRWTAYRPNGTVAESSLFFGTVYCFTNFEDGNGCNPLTRSYANPIPGVWELVVEARRTTPVMDNPYQLEAALTP